MNHQQSQNGAALIMGLIVLTVMSFVGITAMESAMMQTSLASNTQLKIVVFQETETALKRATHLNHMSQSMDEADDTIELSYTNNAYEGPRDINSTVEYCGTLPSQNIRGLSLNANQAANTNGYAHYVFDINATVELSAGGHAQSQHIQRSSRLMLAAPEEVSNVCF